MTDIPSVPDIPFDQAEYERVTGQIRDFLHQAGDSILPGLGQVFEALSYATLLPGPVVQWIVDAVNALFEFLKDVLNFILDLFEGVAAPILFFVYDWGFKSEIRSCVTDAQGEVAGLPIASSGDPLWQGRGSESYRGTVPKQDTAMGQTAAIMEQLGALMGELAGAGLMLYVAILAAVAAFSGTVSAVILEALSIVGLPAVPPTAVTGGSLVAAAIAAVGGIFTYITTLTNRLSDLDALTSDNTAFPGGAWPVAVAPGAQGVMDDGSVADGDADWSVPAR